MTKKVFMENIRLTPDEYLVRINKLLKDKNILLLDIYELSEKEVLALEKKDASLLEKLSGSKQKKINKINKIDDAFLIFFERFKKIKNISSFEELNALEYPILSDIKKETVNIKSVLEKLSKLDKDNQEKVSEYHRELQKKIQKINFTKKTNSAYKPATYAPPSYYIDKKK